MKETRQTFQDKKSSGDVAKKEFPELYYKYKQDMEHLLRKDDPSIPGIIITLQLLQERTGRIGSYLKETNYHVFRWSKEHDSLKLFQALIKLTKDSGHLGIYLKKTKKKTNCELFQWGLEHNSPEITQALMSLLSKEDRLSMISHNDYSAIRSYIDTILKLDIETYEKVILTKKPVLNSLIDIYLKNTNYELFQQGLEHDSLRTIQVLMSLLSERRKFLMVTDNEYFDIKNYIRDILQLRPKAYEEISSTKLPILKAVVGIKPDPVLEAVNEFIKKNKRKKVANILLKDIEKIANELTSEEDHQIQSMPVSLKSKHQPKKHVRFENKENSKVHHMNSPQQSKPSVVKNRKSKRPATTIQEVTQNGNQTTPASCMPSPEFQPKRRSVRQKNRKVHHTDSSQELKPGVVENRKRKTTQASYMSSHGLFSELQPKKRAKFDNRDNSKGHTNDTRRSERIAKIPVPG